MTGTKPADTVEKISAIQCNAGTAEKLSALKDEERESEKEPVRMFVIRKVERERELGCSCTGRG